VEASSTPTICRLPDSRRHQLSAIALADDDLQDLTKARKVLIEMRHDWAKAIAAGYKRGETETAIKGIIEVQLDRRD